MKPQALKLLIFFIFLVSARGLFRSIEADDLIRGPIYVLGGALFFYGIVKRLKEISKGELL